jgi:hypothetical protein
MGGEWAKAVKMIFNKKYSNGRGKLVDAMKDPETKKIHADMLGKKPMKKEKKNKTMKGGQVDDDNEEEGGSNMGSRKSMKNRSFKGRKGKKSVSFRKKTY